MAGKFLQALFATTAMTVAFSPVAKAQAAPAEGTAANNEDDIIVTARRADGRLQDV
jgi:hypothetical protein